MMQRTAKLLLGISLLAALGADVATAQDGSPGYDILIRNARILDGTGSPAFAGTIAIRDGHIAAVAKGVGPLAKASAKTLIDAKGLVVAPGFIDLHTHSEMPLIADGNAESMVRDGVTTNVTGEASSVAPRDGLPVEGQGAVKQDWTTLTGYFDRLKEKGISINIISHVAEGQLRRVVMGYSDAAPTPEQMAQMEALLARAM